MVKDLDLTRKGDNLVDAGWSRQIAYIIFCLRYVGSFAAGSFLGRGFSFFRLPLNPSLSLTSLLQPVCTIFWPYAKHRLYSARLRPRTG
jgi:hypothetical protein